MSKRIVACSCTCADQCPQGRTGSADRCRIVTRDVPDPLTFTVESDRELIGEYRLRVSEHGDRGFVGIDAGLSSHAILLEPAQLVAAASALLNVASNIIERKFQRQVGEP